MAFTEAIVQATNNSRERVAENVKAIVQTKVAHGTGSKEPNNQSVYVLVTKTEEIMYVGRTNNPGRRETEHKNSAKHPERQKYDMRVIQSGLTVDQARVLEQIIISSYVIGPGRVDGHLRGLDNSIRGIAVGKVDLFSSINFEKAQELLGTVLEDELRELMKWR